jgi:phage-related protein|tara:strand:- start:1231 stop:1752 length:522 start_codon:yes stop_codon:yes gene_type:complete
MTYLAFNDIKLEFATQAKRSTRIQRAQFGDGYSQVLTDGLNTDVERWECTTGLLTNEEAHSIESYLLSLKGAAIPWIPPLNTKTFSRPFESGRLKLGYTNISTLTLTGYTRPANYTANLATGVLDSVDISDGTVVAVSLTQSAKNYLLDDGWSFELVTPIYSRLKFNLTQVYI